MAIKVLFMLVIVCSVQRILGRDCSQMESILNCNECIRCGGFWCNTPIKGTARCAASPSAGWCPDGPEAARTAPASRPGDVVSPAHSELTAPVGRAARVPLVYTAGGEKTVSVTIVDPLQSGSVSVSTSTNCSTDQCTLTLEVVPGQEFCSNRSGLFETVDLGVKFESVPDDVSVRLHVPCACACAGRVELKSSQCGYRGDYSCGVCTCQSGWGGERCGERVCKKQRGDVQCTNPARDTVDCSGNGVCGPCNWCECDTSSRGWQYLEPEWQCADLCLHIGTSCDHCLEEPRAGEYCRNCRLNLFHLPYNASLVDAKDEWGRSEWVLCNDTINNCRVEYAARKQDGDVVVMVSSLCGDVIAAPVAATINVTLPVILGAAALLCAAAAAAGYAAWRARSRPLPLADPQYENIGAEDCIGENPLYKPPTSSYKNPTYGKW